MLVKGGDLAFGQQRDALEFFEVESTDKIFQRFGDEQETWPPKFRSHPSYGSELATNKFELTSNDKSTSELPIGFRSFRQPR